MYEGIRNFKQESKQTYDNSVKTSFLSEEELKKYRGDKVMELTKELYIQRKKANKNDIQIAREFNLHTPVLSGLKTKWGLNGKRTKDFLGEEKPPAAKEIDMSKFVSKESHEILIKEQLAKQEMEIEKISLEHAADYEKEIQQLKEQNENLVGKLDESMNINESLNRKIKEASVDNVKLMNQLADPSSDDHYKKLFEASSVLLKELTKLELRAVQ